LWHFQRIGKIFLYGTRAESGDPPMIDLSNVSSFVRSCLRTAPALTFFLVFIGFVIDLFTGVTESEILSIITLSAGRDRRTHSLPKENKAQTSMTSTIPPNTQLMKCL
jgi:hypothetical protein